MNIDNKYFSIQELVQRGAWIRSQNKKTCRQWQNQVS